MIAPAVQFLRYSSVQLSAEILCSMVSELVSDFEHRVLPSSSELHWISDSGATQVYRYGSSTHLQQILSQNPDAISAEYEVLFHGDRVFYWVEHLWPHLRSGEPVQHTNKPIWVPSACANDLMRYHIDSKTPWLDRYRRLPSKCRSIKIDEVGVVAETNRVQLL